MSEINEYLARISAQKPVKIPVPGVFGSLFAVVRLSDFRNIIPCIAETEDRIVISTRLEPAKHAIVADSANTGTNNKSPVYATTMT